MDSNGKSPKRPKGVVIQNQATKSGKIRALFSEGYPRADIARYLKVSYQHVYNVLTAPPPKGSLS